MKNLIIAYGIFLILSAIAFIYYMYVENIKLMILYGFNIIIWQNNLFMLMKIKE